MIFGYDENHPPEEDSINLDGDSKPRPAYKPRQARRDPPFFAVFWLFEGNPAKDIWRMRPLEREAARILFEKYGIDELRKRYTVIKQHKGEEYCPEIDNPCEMLEKMVKMEAFLKKL